MKVRAFSKVTNMGSVFVQEMLIVKETQSVRCMTLGKNIMYMLYIHYKV